MKQEVKEVKAGQTWEVQKFWLSWEPGHNLIVMCWHPHLEGLILVDDGVSYKKAPGNCVEQYCKLIRDEQPEEVETEVIREDDGLLEMGCPGEATHRRSARQGEGHRGYTCVGFRFKENREDIWPSPLRWRKKIGEMLSWRSYGDDDSKLVVATHAVWRKLGA